MSERKVLNKYYPPDFDPSKIPRAKGSKNRQFTVRLMAPCNMKCYTCGEYIAQGKKFNARKEDVEDMTYLGLRIYRFYIRCPGCISEISFRTDPESTDYIIEAGAHRNFQALKLAEQQAEREAQEAQEEIESNPMLLLENRTKQSQYEMDLLESLEDVRELNERRAVLDPGAIAVNFQKARELSSEEIAEAESLEVSKALGYELIEGKFVKRINEDLLTDEIPRKKIKSLVSTPSDHLTDGKPLDKAKVGNSLKAKLSGLVRKKSPTTIANTENKMNDFSSLQLSRKSQIEDSIRMPPPQSRTVAVNNNKISSSNNIGAATTSMTSASNVIPGATSFITTKPDATASACDADAEVVENPISSMSSGLTMLGAYSTSDSDSD